MMKNSNKKLVVGKTPKRIKAGHNNTTGAVCLLCYEAYKRNQKKIFNFSRFNGSTMKEHMKSHRNVLKPDYSNYFVSEEDPRATEAIRALKTKTKPKPTPHLISSQEDSLQSIVAPDGIDLTKDDGQDLSLTSPATSTVPGSVTTRQDSPDLQYSLEGSSQCMLER